MRVRTHIEGEDIAYRNLWRIVERQLEYADANRRGSTYDHLVAMVFSFHTFEAYLNFVGERLAPEIWADERNFFRKEPYRGFDGKMKKVFELMSITPDFATKPFNAIEMLKNLRDRIAHAKTEKISRDVEHDSSEQPDLDYPMFGGLVTHANATSAAADIKAVVEVIHKLARKQLRDDYWFGETAFDSISYHASGASYPVD